MTKEKTNDYKLGIFLLAGLLLVVFALYMIGKDQSLFTDNFKLRARFRDVAGLMPGNNVRYAGIQNGTVKSIRILDDTTIEVTMYVNEDARMHIRKSSVASIGTEGLMGNKVINITPGESSSPLAEENDILLPRATGSLDDAMNTLYRTNDNAAIVAGELVHTVRLINNSPVLQALLYDTALPLDIHNSVSNIRAASVRLNRAAGIVEETISGVRNGRGTLGLLLADEDSRARTAAAVHNIQLAGDEAGRLVNRLDVMATDLQSGLNSSTGLVHLLLRDTTLTGRIGRSMENIESGTAAFNEDMEALKHNFLTRGYFRKMERKSRADK